MRSITRPSSRRKSKGATVRHVAGPELLEGVRQYALKEFGPMVVTVFSYWGIRSLRGHRAHGFQPDRRRNFRKNRGGFDRGFQKRLRFSRCFRETVRCRRNRCLGKLPPRFARAESFMNGLAAPSSRFSSPYVEHRPSESRAAASNSAVITFPPISAQKWVLPDGLTIIVQEDRSAPVASVQAWCGDRQHQRRRASRRGAVAHSRAHAFQGNEDALDQRDRAENPGRGRLHQRLHVIRSHRFLDRRAEGWRRDARSIFCPTR